MPLRNLYWSRSMFFGGLFCAYLVYRHWYYGDFSAASETIAILPGAINTAVLICSSLTVVLAVRAAQLNKRLQLVFWLLATIVLGLAFLGIKAFEYYEKFVEHHIPGVNFSFIEHLPNQPGVMDIGELELLPAVRKAPPDWLVIADGFSCREQISQSTDRQAFHLAEILQMAIRNGPEGIPGSYPERYSIREREAEVHHSMRKAGLAVAGVVALSGLLWGLHRRQ